MKQPSRHGTIAGLSAALAGALCLTAVPGAFAADSPDVSALSVHGGTQRIANTPATGKAKNVILFIGDGMGDSENTIARDYLYGPGGSFEGLDKIGQPGATSAKETGTGQYTTYATGDGSGRRNQVTAVTDSAASGSGWATGTKTYNNAVSVDNNFNPQMNLIELAKAKGLATGNVTTAEIQDATPAVLESHSTQRSCYGPQGKSDGSSDDSAKRCDVAQLKQNGGIGSISEQLLDTRADVTFGGGSKYFNQTAQVGEYQGMTLKDQAKARGYQYVEAPAQLGSLSEANQSSPVLGLFAAGNLPTQYNESKTYDGKTAQEIALKGQQDGNASLQTCTANPDWLGNKGASLADMTNKAIDLLSANKNGKDNGYFLQVEDASIDKQDHNANVCGQIGETDDLDKAISAALKKVDLSNTLIIVTADHAHTSQLASWPSMYALNTPLRAKDGTAMYVMYGTASSQNGSQSHTGTQLHIAASGPGASRVDGLTDQTDNFFTIAKTLGLASSTEDINALSSGAKVSVKDGVAQVTGFNGDAVLGYQLQDTETGAVLAASNDDTPVSGVRVATGATATIDFNGVKGFDPSGSTYTLTVTGKQSGTKIATEFGLTGNGASNVVVAPKTAAKAGLGDAMENGGIAGALVGALGKTGTRILGTVMVALALAVAGGLLAAWRRGLFARK